MSRQRPTKTPADEKTAASEHPHHPTAAGIRETIESIVVAFALAFLFRTFEAEAFVIPTGSMAPTLMGRHKDVVCPKCGCSYQVSASEEVTQDGASLGEMAKIEAGTCPMCRYTAMLAKDPSYNGDRILVGKLAYDFGEPRRWDVIVFKYPAEAQINFIKRLIGLPGETIRIQNGDIWVRRHEDKDKGDDGFTIARKPPRKLLAMLQPVFDNDYMPRIVEYGWPARWYADPATEKDDADAWTSPDPATFRCDGKASGANWLRYHHLTPTYAEWQLAHPPRPAPRLITDFTAYDTGRSEAASRRTLAPDPDGLGDHWVGDLALFCTVDVESDAGQLILELCKGDRRFQCRFDVATGSATLAISGDDLARWRPTAQTAVRGRGRHNVIFSNCDNQLRLWVDGSVVEFNAPTAYPDLGNTQPTNADLAPVGVATDGAAVRLSHLRIKRDLYYIAMTALGGHPLYHDLTFSPDRPLPNRPILVPPSSERHLDFSLESGRSEPGKFFVLGDNSAKSKDGRLWGPEYWVSRELLIGKAIFIYWPHSWDRLPYVPIPFPYFPNFGRMGLVR